MDLLLPPAVPPGGTVALVSPSWGGPAALPARHDRAVRALTELGFDVRPMPHALGSRGHVSGTAAERLADLHAAFADPEVDLVLATIGGQHSAHLLQGLDADLIREHPTAFCGYSDMTVLHHALHARTGLVTFYGPALLPELGEVGGPDAEVVQHWLRTLTQAEPSGVLPVTDWQSAESRQDGDAAGRPRRRRSGEPRRVLRAGTGTGPLLPGCLPSVRQLVGTPWQPSYDGRVLVLETPEAPYGLEDADADLAHLRNAGLLADLAALVVGRTDEWDPAVTAALHEVVLDAARGTDYPVLAGVECTHAAPLLTLPLGVRAQVTGTELVVLDPAVH